MIVIKIALDYDQTFTLDPDFWSVFKELAYNYGHEVRIVTARAPEEDKIPVSEIGGTPVIYCDGIAKRFYCTWFADDRRGWVPDVWIDDRPQSVDNNSTATREALEEWRETR